jgi:signal transduction histidine kinase
MRLVPYFPAAERWIGWVRLAAVALAIFQVAFTSGYPAGDEARAWATVAVFGAGALAILAATLRPLSQPSMAMLGAAALVFDAAVATAFVLEHYFQVGTPIRQILMLVIVEAALRYGVVGAFAVVVAMVPVLVLFEHLREQSRGAAFHSGYVTLQVGAGAILGSIVGWLVLRLRDETASAQMRAAEAEELRDQLGRRVDTLEAVNRCARALASSLDLEPAFGAFIRELRGLVPADRTGIVMIEGDSFRVIAAAGRARRVAYPVESGVPLPPDVLAQIRRGATIVRDDMRDGRYEHERGLVERGLRSRVSAPLLAGPRTIGMLSLSRTEPSGFTAQEIELVTLLGRLAGTAVQNITAHRRERETADELRRLSALRADFVSLVSHELRSPMAAVIGSARTLQQRWRQLAPEQRDAFLALIADETDRLTALIADVLDTSRIEAGTFSYAFADVDVAALARDTATAAQLAQDEVPVIVEANGPVPRVRGDRERLRQVLANLIDNAVKYSPAGEAVQVKVQAESGGVRVEVRDRGPGIAVDQQELIFEKFGRADVSGGAKPGTGLGLFIARSIAEAHGGRLEVGSLPGAGSTFTLTLPGR